MMVNYSVLMSLYKKEKPEYLVLAIESMLNQTIKPEQIVIVEDGPLTDELYDIINNYANKYSDIFTIIKNVKNIGLGLSLNNGLKVCRNEIVARMDTDDISKPFRCEKQLEVFNNNEELSIVGSWVDEFNEKPENVVSVRVVPEKNEEIYDFAKKRSAFNHPVVMYKKSKILENNGYSDLRRNQDVDLFGRMLFNGCKAYNIQESLLWFRSNIDLAKRRKSWENTKSYIQTIKRFKKMGYASFWDYHKVKIAQIILFLLPAKMQNWVYKKFLRK